MSKRSSPRRILRVAITGWVEPSTIRAVLFGDIDWQIWLDAGSESTLSNVPQCSYLGAGRTRVVTASVDFGTVTERILSNGLTRTFQSNIFEFLRNDVDSPIEVSAEDSTSFALGWVGWFGYELGAQTVGAPTATHAGRESEIPDACLIFLDRAIEFDHATQSITALSFETDTEWADEVAAVVARLVEKTGNHSSRARDGESGDFHVDSVAFRHSRSGYEHLIESCLDEIRAGNAYQLCLTNRIDIQFDSAPNPFDVFERLRLANPTHHGGLIVADGVSLVSSSPEVFLTVTPAGHVTTKPIKGTRPRGSTDDHDVELKRELVESDKERAENLMIVDLMRNDLGRVSRVGSVTVEKLLDIETYANVHQLVSTVGGDLAPGLTVVDALEACFPAGSMTGAPKLAAMRILNRLEAGSRGIYSGAFGYISLDGSCDLAMVIRSIVLHGTHATIGTGGGITSGSAPSEEWEETLVKARPLLGALGITDHPA